jgi:hypothetical protein
MVLTQTPGDAGGETVAGAELRARMSSGYPIDGDHPLVPMLHTTFDAARAFGLSDDELWMIVRETLSGAEGSPDVSEWVDVLNGELAQAILAKSRSSLNSLAGDAWLEGRWIAN